MNEEEKFNAKMLKIHTKKAIYIYIYFIGIKLIQLSLMVCLKQNQNRAHRLILIGIKLIGTWFTITLFNKLIMKSNNLEVREFSAII